MEEIKANIGVEENSTETKEISIENKTTEQLQSENEQLRKDSQQKDGTACRVEKFKQAVVR